MLVADRGLGSEAHLARLVPAGGHAGLRVGARPMVDFTPGRPLVRPSVRRTSAVTGVPRSRWLNMRGVHDPCVAWVKPKTCPSWLAKEMLAARPESFVLRAGRDHIGTPGFRTRPMTRVTRRRAAEVHRVADLAELDRQRWPGDTSLAQLKTTRPMEVLPGHTAPGVRKELTVFALVDNRVRRVLGHSAMRQHLGMERISVLEARRWLGAPRPGIPFGAWLVHPVRPQRVEPRVQKRRPQNFPLMIKPRPALCQQWLPQELRG